MMQFASSWATIYSTVTDFQNFYRKPRRGASQFGQGIEHRPGLKICCPEESALRLGYIAPEEFFASVRRCKKSSYGQYLLALPQIAPGLFPANLATLTQAA